MKRVLLSFIILFCVLISIRSYSQNPNFSYTQTCYGNQTTLVASSSLADTSISMWQWDLDGNGSYEMAGKTIISLVTINDTVSVRLKITPVSGTADSITKNVIIDPLPQVNFIASNLCETKSATYISQSVISPGSISQFLWDFNNDGVTDDNTNDTVQYTCGPASTYITKLTCVSDKGCSAFTQKVTTVYPNPTASFSTSNACVNANATFNNTSTITNPDFYLWNFGDGNSSATSGNASHAYTTSGTYAVDLIAVSLEGCRDTATSAVTINQLPLANFTYTVTCWGNNTCFTNLSTGDISNWQWDFGDITIPTSTLQNPCVQYSAVSLVGYDVSLFVTDINGCSHSTNLLVKVNPLPVVSITASDTVLRPGSSMMLIAEGASSYSWSTGSFSNNITVTESGTYKVLGTDANGCTAWDSILVKNENEDVVFVSVNIMTPNGDGINDYLMIESIGKYTNCDLKVYNMWNDEVYSVSGYKNDWGGYGNDGKQVPDGPYYYIISCDDKPVLKGNINIILR